MIAENPGAYKRTFFDRHGPEAAAYVSAGVWGVAIGSVMLVVSLAGGAGFLGVIASLVTAAVVAGMGPTIGYVFGSFWNTVAVNGGSTPSVPQYSYEQALIMQGKVAEALASLETIIAGDAATIQARIFAADLYFREGNNAARAAELLRDAQKIRPISTGDDIYIANRLVDLYVGPLNTPYKALRELRRVIDQYQNSSAANHARAALAKLKERYVTLERP
jgi:hypothetical protein